VHVIAFTACLSRKCSPLLIMSVHYAALCLTRCASCAFRVGAVAPVPEWPCTACTTPNPAAASTCSACGTGKGAWVCNACTFLAQADAVACPVCGTAKPPAPVDPAALAVFGGAGGAGSSWLLGKLLCQMLFLQEEDGPKTDLKHPSYWFVFQRVHLH
jgi:hypothetical protein